MTEGGSTRRRMSLLLGIGVTAALSAACVLYVGRGNASVLLRALFLLWVLLPYGLLAAVSGNGSGADSTRRPGVAILAIVVCAASLATYAVVVFGPRSSKPAFWFLVVPLIAMFAVAAWAVATRTAKPDRRA
jgi:hypothetical protein